LMRALSAAEAMGEAISRGPEGVRSERWESESESEKTVRWRTQLKSRLAV
jgi:hypothetical protein